MADLFDSLGASTLLRGLHATVKILERINISGSESEVAALAEQVSDLVAIVHSFEDLATQERRHASVQLRVRSPVAIIHLRTVLDSTAAIIHECAPFVRPLQSSLGAFDHEGNAARSTGIEYHLEEQPWYEETYQALRLFAEVLRALYTAIELLQFQEDFDEETQSPKTRSFIATQLYFQLSVAEQRLHANDQYDSYEV